jgi:hypothetical protein
MGELLLRTTDDRAKVLGRIRLDGDRAVFDGGVAEDIFRSVQRRRHRSGGSDPEVFALFGKGWSNGPLAIVKADAEKVAAAADDQDNGRRKPTDAAVAALLAGWPAMAAPLITDLTRQATKAAGLGALGSLAVSKRVTNSVADKLTPVLVEAADAAATETVADAQRQGATVDQSHQDRDHLGQIALAAVGLIAMAYAGAAARRAMLAGPSAVHAALAPMGEAPTGVVADQLAAAIHAARHAGRVSVFEAHPPTRLIASEDHDTNRCEPCAAIDGHAYADLASALVDYGSGSYRSCAGGLRCRGELRGEWT